MNNETNLTNDSALNEVRAEEMIVTAAEIEDWKKVDEYFDSESIKEWKKHNFTAATAQQWIELGFWTSDYWLAAQWRDHFSWVETNHWIKELDLYQAKFQQAAYWKIKGTIPTSQAELIQLWQAGIPAQKLLNTLYPKDAGCLIHYKSNNQGKTRDQITELSLRGLDLTGPLDLTDFINLEELDCSLNELTSLTVNHYLELRSLDVNRNQLTELILPISKNLKSLNCSDNQLTNLTLSTSNQLKAIYLRNNLLTNFNYTVLNPATLTHLDLADNNLAATELTVFSPLINLEWLQIGNNKKQSIYNKFSGSLQSLAKLTKLKNLGIYNTDINDGVEYLPNSLKHIPLFNAIKARPNCKWKEIEYLMYIREKSSDLFNLIMENFTTKSFQIELNKYKKLFSSNNEQSDLIRRWEKTNLDKLSIITLRKQIKTLEEKKLKGEEIKAELNLKNKQLEAEITKIEREKEIKLFQAYKELEELKNASLNLFSNQDKEQLKELINLHKELIQAKNLKQSTYQINKSYQLSYHKLADKIGISFIDSIDLILNNFESFYQLEFTIEERINQKAEYLSQQIFIDKQLNNLESFIIEIKDSIAKQEQLKIKDSSTIINYFIEKKKEITYYGDIIQSIVDSKKIEMNEFSPSLIKDKSENELTCLVEQLAINEI